MREIETERLTLRQISIFDAEEMMDLWGDFEVIKYTYRTLVESLEECRSTIVKFQMNIDEEMDLGPYSVFDDGGLAGLAGIKKMDDGVYSLFYQFKKDRWGMGYATEAAAALLEAGFNNKKIDVVHAECVAENPASEKVLIKNGFRFVERVKDGFNRNGIVKDLLRFECWGD